MRRQFSPTQKATVALAALKGDKTINQIASEYEVNPTQVKQWRDKVKAAAAEAFADNSKKANSAPSSNAQIDELHRVIGKRDAELEWLKKKLHGRGSESLNPRSLTALIEPEHPTLTISRQAELLGLSRRSYYYQPVVNEAEVVRLKQHLNAVDEIYTKYPFYGTRRIDHELKKSYGINIGRERIRHLMEKLGLEAIYPKPNTKQALSSAPHISLLAARHHRCLSRPHLGYGYYLHPDLRRLCVFGSYH